MLDIIVNRENIDEVVTDILHDMTVEQLAHYATKDASQGIITKSGYELPKSAVGGTDGICGIDTDFPVPAAMGQTWNKALLEKIGSVIGTEIRGRYDFDDPNTLVYTAVSDMREIHYAVVIMKVFQKIHCLRARWQNPCAVLSVEQMISIY